MIQAVLSSSSSATRVDSVIWRCWWSSPVVVMLVLLVSLSFSPITMTTTCQGFMTSMETTTLTKSSANHHQSSSLTSLSYFSSNQEDKLLSKKTKKMTTTTTTSNHNSKSRMSSSSSSSSSSSLSSSRTNRLMADQQRKNQEITRQWEAEIQANTKEQSDVKRVQQWLQNDQPSYNKSTTSTSPPPLPASDGWKVALAAGTVCGLGCEWCTDSTVLSISTFVTIFIAALQDPLKEDDDSVAGPIARIIGRSALKSYHKSQPKLKAVARAAVQGGNKDDDEMVMTLQTELQELRKENETLRIYKQRREWIDDQQSHYNLEELKVLAQRYSIPYSGMNKAQLMMKLLQVGALLTGR